MSKETRLREARAILQDLGLPSGQQNDRTALCLLALLNLTPDKKWSQSAAPMMGITPIMAWAREHYDRNYAPNTRETFRRQSMHQLVDAGGCLYNPDKPSRPVNSPKAVYQIAPELLSVLKRYGTPAYKKKLKAYLSVRKSLAEKYAKHREIVRVPLKVKDGYEISLSAGEHSTLIKQIIEGFAPRFVPKGQLLYVGDTGDKYGYFDIETLKQLGVYLDPHAKLPDVVIYSEEKNWLFLIESVTSHGPVDPKRQTELERLFGKCRAGLVYVSAFPSRKHFLRYMKNIAWETEVWIADAPSHMIHFNGDKFLGPYK
jgi:hypothetical protein